VVDERPDRRKPRRERRSVAEGSLRPPRLARWLLQHGVPAGPARDGLLGDLEEIYVGRVGDRVRWSRRRLAADVWFFGEALFALLRYRPWVERLLERRSAAATGGGAGANDSPANPTRRAGLCDALRELRLAARQLGRSPGFTLAAVLTLALGIGVTAALITVVWDVVLAPLPFPEPDRLVVIEHRLPGYPSQNGEVVFGGFQGQVLQYAERSRELVEVGAYGSFDGAITEVESPEYTRIGYATPGFFRALGVRPQAGRLFEDEEPDAADGLGAAILGDGLARQRYGSATALGELIHTEGFAYEVVGVLPPRQSFPPRRVAVWHPRSLRTLRDNPVWTVDVLVGRMAPGATPESVERELAGLVAQIPQRFPGSAIETVARNGHMAPQVTPMKQWLLGDTARALWLLLAAAGLVMAIACVNVANLMLVRTQARRAELAMRVALGASRRQMALHFFAHGVALCALTALPAAALALAGVRALPRWLPADLPRMEEIVAGGGTLSVVVVLCFAAAVVLTAVPALAHRRFRFQGLASGARTFTAGRRQVRAHDLMVGVQVALAVVLLVGAGLVLRSVQALGAVDPGFEPAGVLSFRVTFPYKEVLEGGSAQGRATPFFDELSARIGALPGVTSVGYGICIPMAAACSLDGYPIKQEGSTPEDPGAQPLAGLQPVSPGFIESLGIPLLAGRGLEPTDHRQRSDAVLVSAALAERLWPGQSALGKRLEQGGGSAAENFHFHVVGVVGDVRFDRLRDDPELVVYTPVLFGSPAPELYSVSFVVRSAVAPRSLIDDVRATVSSLRADVPVADVETMDAVVASSTASMRFAMALLAAGAATALLLAAIGVYGVVAYVVGVRRNEFGIRMALGARDEQLRALVVRERAGPLLAGLTAGLAGAAVSGRLLGALLYGVPATDPPTYAAVALFLTVTTVLAALLPARRAGRLPPAEVLRRS